MSAARLIRRIPWLDNLLSTQVSFALGSLCVFIPMFSAMVRQEGILQAARRDIASMHEDLKFAKMTDEERAEIPSVPTP